MRHVQTAVMAVAVLVSSWKVFGASPVVTAAYDLGVTPDVLAASGFTATEAAALLGRIEQAGERRVELGVRRQALSTASTRVAAANKALALEPDEPELLEERASAEANRQAEASGLAQFRSVFRGEILEGFESGKQQALDRWDELSASTLPASFRVASWTASELRILQAALAAERRGAQGAPSSGGQAAETVLAQARARSEVVLADLNLAARLTEIREVFDSWPSGE